MKQYGLIKQVQIRSYSGIPKLPLQLYDTNEQVEAQTENPTGGICDNQEVRVASDMQEVQEAIKTKRRIIKPKYLTNYI